MRRFLVIATTIAVLVGLTAMPADAAKKRRRAKLTKAAKAAKAAKRRGTFKASLAASLNEKRPEPKVAPKPAPKPEHKPEARPEAKPAPKPEPWSLRFGCGVHRPEATAAPVVTCEWALPAVTSSVTSWRLWRAPGLRDGTGVVFRTDDPSTRFARDPNVELGGRYVYVLEGLRGDGVAVSSEFVKVVVEREQPKPEPKPEPRPEPKPEAKPEPKPNRGAIALACKPFAEEGRHQVYCGFTLTDDTRAWVHRLVRQGPDGAVREIVRTDSPYARDKRDGEVSPGATYTYLFEALAKDGSSVARSGYVTVTVTSATAEG